MKKRNRIRQILSLMLALALFMSSVPVTDVAYAAELTSEVQSEESTEAASTEEADSSESTTEEAKSEEAAEETSKEEVVVEDDEAEANREDIKSPVVNGTIVTFNLADPEKEYTSVHVAGDIPGAVWGVTAPDFEMNYDADKGCWTLTVESLPAGTYNYKFIVNGGEWMQDPSNDPEGNDNHTEQSNSTFYIADPNKVSPVVNGNEVTFNYYPGQDETVTSVELVGEMNNWGEPDADAFDEPTDNGCWSLTRTFNKPGVYKYKFWVNGRNGWRNDPLNSKKVGDDNAFVIAGLTDSQVDVVVAQATELPKMDFYDTEINPSKVDVTSYELADKTAAYASKVTLEGNTITLAEDIEAESFDLTATYEGYTATLTVNVKSTSTPKEDETVKSPVVDGKEVTFNLYGPKYESVHVVGTIPGAAWGTMEDANKMTYNEDTAYWSIKMTIPAGNYEYKFITNGDTTNGYIHDPLNKPEDLKNNCTFTVAGLGNSATSVSLGDTKTLPKTLKLYAADGTAKDAEVTYELTDKNATWKDKVTLTEKDGVTTLAVAKNFPAATVTSFELTATADKETATVTVTVNNTTVKSPVIEDGKVTFNYVAEDKETPVKLAGNMTGWQAGAKDLTYNKDKGLWTITLDLGPGDYQYKFIDGKKENDEGKLVDNWIQDPLNDPDGDAGNDANSTFVIAGLANGADKEVKIGASVALDKTLKLYDAEGKSTDEAVTYALADDKAEWAKKVTLTKDEKTGVTTLTVAEDFPETVTEFELTATAGDRKATVKVKVVSVMYKYTIYYYDEIHATGENGAMKATDASLYIWNEDVKGVEDFYDFDSVEVLADGRTWAKAEISLSYTNVGLITKSYGKTWDGKTWQEADKIFNNENKAEEVTLYLIGGDDEVYTELPEVQETEKRYFVVEYIRNDGSAKDWYTYTWCGGYGDVFADFKETDGRWSSALLVVPGLASIEYCVAKYGTAEDGTQTKWDEQDGKNYLADLPLDQSVIKVQMEEGKGITFVYPSNKGFEFDTENDEVDFYYRDDKAFLEGPKGGAHSVQIEIDGKTYDMTYDAKEQRYEYSLKGLKEQSYNYRYLVKSTEQSEAKAVLDAYNTAKVVVGGVEYSTCRYGKYEVEVSAKMFNASMDYNQSNVLTIEAKAKEGADITGFEVAKATVDLTALGGSSKAEIDPELLEVSIALKQGIAAGTKTLPVTVYDQYGNQYETETTVEVKDRVKKENDFDWDEAVIYFAITDRFFDGNEANNTATEGFDKQNPLGYHGGDLAGLTKKIDYLNELGINTIWLTPIVDNVDEGFDAEDKDAGYKTKHYAHHGYWASDFTKLNPHLGNEEELKALIDAAHNKGMKIMVDVVLNHAGYESADTFNTILKDADGNYINMVRGKAETIKGDTIKDGLSGLPDFITENAEVRNQLVKWQTEWMTKYDIDYYRVDTVKHVENTTWSAFKNSLVKSNPEFKLIGEYYDATYASQAGQLDSGKMDSLLDFAFKHYAKDFALGNISGIEATLADRNSKLSNTATMGAFLGSHDEDGMIQRFMKEAGKTREEAEALMKVAATLQITAKGQPVIYYGEEIGLTGENNYPYQTNRYDFDWSKAEAQKKEANSMLNHYTKLLNIRKVYSEVFAKGDRRSVVGGSALGYEVIRRGYNGKNVYVAMNVKGEAVETTFNVTAGAVYTDLYSNKTYTATADGKLTISIPAMANGGTAILVTDANEETKDTNTITVKIHYNRPDGNYDGWSVWSWAAGKSGADYPFVDENGEKVVTVEVEGRATSSVGYIIRTQDWNKDVDGDQFIDVSDILSGTVHFYVNSGVAGGVRILGADAIQGTKVLGASFDGNTKNIVVKVTPTIPVKGDFTKAFKVTCVTDNVEIPIKDVKANGSEYIIILDKDISSLRELVKTYKLTFEGYDYGISLPSIYSSEDFEKNYTYTGNDLGATWSSSATTFKLWAPTAESVKVALYKSGTAGTDDKLGEYPMTLGEAGVWSLTLDGNHEGKYYTYLVNVENKVVEACDPYARTTGVNGKRAMIIDLESTNPEGWDMDKGPHTGMNYTDAVIYELHVRDASIHESSGVSAANKGKYLGLTETGTKTNGGVATALDHIKDLGVTHVHLLPVYDYGSVDETRLDQPQFNWGYDPANYNVPEGSYSTDPYNGEVRVEEFKQMVKTMHDSNINVVMDVVYNHVYSADDFCFNQIVPKYFSRTNEDGSYTSASGCGNDTASERAMVRKYIVDSVLYWAKEYHIDGFRFDLVGLIDAETMNAVITEVHKYDPDIIFYGEGWDMKPVPEGVDMSIMQNAKLIPELAFFSDTFRNNVAGNHMEASDPAGFVSGTPGKENIMGDCVTGDTEWCPNPTQTVNYASCHDNYTLKDKLNKKAADATEEERIKMNNLTAAMYMMSEGIPFIHAGEEFLRTKVNENGDVIENSYNSSDFVNAIRWNNLEDATYADVADYYKGLIEFRKNHKVLRLTTKEEVAANVEYSKVGDNLILFKLKGKASVAGEVSDGIVMIFNSNKVAKTVDLSKFGITGDWNVCINAEDSGIETLATVNGTVEVAPISALVMVQGNSKDSGTIYDENVVVKPVNVTAITNIHTTLADIKTQLPEGWSWKYDDIPVAAFTGSSTKNFQAVYTDKAGNKTETEIPVRIITVSKANIASAVDVVEAGKALDVTAALVTVGGNVPAGMVTAEWSVSDAAIATVNPADSMNTAVTGVAAGKATVTVKVTVKDGDKAAEFTATKAVKVIAAELAQIAVKSISEAETTKAGVYKTAFVKDGKKPVITVTSKSDKVTIKSSNAKVVKVGNVTKNEAGEFTAELEIKKAGYVKLTAVANDEVKSQTSVDLYVKDATPKVVTKSIELNKKSNKTAAVYVYANEDFAVESVNIDSEAFAVTRVGESARFEVAVKDKDNAKTGNYNLVIKMAGVETAINSPIKIKVTDKLPKVTVKQTKKINTFFTDAEANGKIAVTSTEKIANVTLTGCGYDYNFATGEVSVSKAEGADASLKKGVLTVSFEGYEETVSKDITIKTENKKPVLKLSAKSGTIYPKANINSTVVSINDTTTGKGIAAANITVDEACKEIYDVQSMDNAVSFTVKAGATAAKATAKITVNKANYSEPVELTYGIKVSNSVPKVVLDKKSVTLNKNAAVKDKETVVINAAVKGVPVSAITELSLGEVTPGIKVEKLGTALVVSFDKAVEAPATGNYKIDVVAKNGEFEFASVTLTVKVIDKAPSAKLSKSGKIDVLNRSNTGIVYKTKLSNVTGRVVDANLTGRFAHLFKADVINGNVVVTVQKNAKVVTKYNYEVGVEVTLSNGVVLAAGTQKIKLTQGKPKVTVVPSESVMFNTVSDSSSVVTFNAVNKDGSEVRIDKVELTNFTNAFAYDKGTGRLSLVGRGEVVEGKTYALKFNVYCKGSADNEKPVTVTYKVKVN